ncbi:BTAD domain-containing putative transcriptional regulator [Dactylosporangium darangshiense]|uniref:Bacterial transcriptional activator domain-containing protein n=1 Tax=Dactylosporangium darangshiense TaxID=579108 RepID=A0ABP8DN26_9ACTN
MVIMRVVSAGRRAASDLYSSGGVWRQYRIARARAIARAAAGAVLLLAAVTGLPIALLLLQRPLLDGFDLAAVVAQPMSAALLAVLGVAGGWLLWLWLVTATVLDVARAVRRHGTPRLLPAPLHAALASMAGILVTATGPDAAHAAAAPAAAVHAPAAATGGTTAAPQAVAGPDPATWARPAATDAAHAGHAAAPTLGNPLASYQVRRGDWLGAISDRYLGDFDRYPELQRLNPGLIRDSAGRRGPDHIEAGWRLILPADAVDRGPRRHATGTSTTATGTEATTAGGGQAADIATPGTTAPPSTAIATPAPSGQPGTATASPAGTPPSPSGSATAAQQQAGRASSRLPGGWLSLPIIAGVAAATVWLRRRRPGRRAGLGDRRTEHQPPALRRRSTPHDADPAPADRSQPDDGRPGPVHPNREHQSRSDADTGLVQAVGWPEPAARVLTGPGAHDAARGLLVTTLTATGDLGDHGQVVVPAETLAALFPDVTDRIAAQPRLHVTASLPEAVTVLETLLIRRHRHQDDRDTGTPDPTTPTTPANAPVLLVTHPPQPDHRARLRAVLQLGAPLQITAVVLGPWPDAEPWTVHADGHTDHPGQHLLLLDPTTARHLLDTSTPPSPNEPPQTAADRPNRAAAQPTGQAVHLRQPPAATAAAAARGDRHPAAETDPVPTPSVLRPDPATPHQSATLPGATPTPGSSSGDGSALTLPVRIRLLGAVAIVHRDGHPVTGMRQHARELLVYLAVHRGGADLTDIMEALWPTATMRRAAQRLSTDTADLRRHLRDAAGQPRRNAAANHNKIEPVVNTGGRYHLNPDVADVDLWHLDDALHAAAASTDPHTQIERLRDAMHAHTGALADGYDYDWIDQFREHTLRQGIHARVRLAGLLAPTDPRTAADLLQAAADLDPLHEDLAGRAMRALATIGDTAAVAHRLDHLRAALATIGETPSTDTITLATDLCQPHVPSPST